MGATLLIVSCARVPVSLQYETVTDPTARAALQTCSLFFADLDRLVTRRKVRDSQAASIPMFPYLRVDRFLESFGKGISADTAFTAWVDRLQHLAEQGHQVELANLPVDELSALQRSLHDGIATGQSLMDIVRECGHRLRHHDLADADTRQRLRKAVQVPPEYVSWQRAVGLYEITANFANAAISKWHKETHRVYAQPVDTLPIDGELVRYVPPFEAEPLGAEAIREIIKRSARNPLGIPEPKGEDRNRLFAAFAPVWQIDVASNNDRIGAPGWSNIDDEKPLVDTQQPTVYRHISHTRFEDEILLQLNYVVWFPSRPRTSSFDYLGGHIDGIMWRVTLSRDGTPLIFDSSHNCGCFHMFFPSRGLQLRPLPNTPEDGLQEPALVPQQAPDLRPGAGPTLRIAHRTHYIERVTPDPLDQGRTVRYRWADYDSLRSLPVAGGGRRSLFRPDGIVPGTKRGERWFFWPLGVPHPGEMRQWGHHATAFVGRRHFDEPYLLERTFIIDPSKAAPSAFSQ